MKKINIVFIYFAPCVLLLANPVGDSIASKADQQIGTEYVWGGTSLDSGVDCSGLVQTLYSQEGVQLPRTAQEQATNTDGCAPVPSLSQAQIGDTLYFQNSSGHIHHVAIVTGFEPDGRPIITHAKGKNYGVVKERMSDRYVSELYTIKRFSDCSSSYEPPEPKDYVFIAHVQATGLSPSQLARSRSSDLNYSYSDFSCCCKDKILRLFRNHTRAIGNRLNPATTNIIMTLSKILETNDLKTERLINLKYANSIYSFYDLNQSDVNASLDNRETPDVTPSGCVPLDFNKEEDKQYYLGLINKFESGGSYTATTSLSSAYGRYQFISSTGAAYCRKVGDGCCADWRSGTPRGMECQDKMFLEFTKDNADFLSSHNLNINSCSVYLSHQLGTGGYLWLKGGKNPYGSFSGAKNVVSKNVGSSYKNEVANATSEEQLRDIYTRFWSDKFGGSILEETGNITDISGLADATHQFNPSKPTPKKIWLREGILLEMIERLQYWNDTHLNKVQKNENDLLQ